MKARRQKLERIRFRDFDARARDALATMLRRTGGGSVPGAGGAEDVDGVLREVASALAGAAGPAGPLAHYALDLEGARIRLLLREVANDEGADALPHWAERHLLTIERDTDGAGSGEWRVVPAREWNSHR